MLLGRRQRLNRPYVRVFVGLVEHKSYLGHSCVEECVHLIATLAGIAQYGHGVDHLVRDELRGSLPVPPLIGF